MNCEFVLFNGKSKRKPGDILCKYAEVKTVSRGSYQHILFLHFYLFEKDLSRDSSSSSNIDFLFAQEFNLGTIRTDDWSLQITIPTGILLMRNRMRD